MDEEQLAALALRVFAELRRAGKWLTLRQLAFRVLGDQEMDAVVEAACQRRTDLFALHQDRRAKLASPEMYAPDFDPSAPPAPVVKPSVNEYWVYVSDWDVAVMGEGPYRAVVHAPTCSHVEARVHKAEGVGVKNYWRSFPTLADAVKFAESVHPWSYCSVCIRA